MPRTQLGRAILTILLLNGGILAYACWSGLWNAADVATEAPQPGILIPEGDEGFTTFELLMEALELCREVCGAEDQTGATVDPKTLERTCLCPDGTLHRLPPIFR